MSQSNNLNTFKTLFLIYGIMLLLFSLFPLAYAFMGEFLSQHGDFQQAEEELHFNPGIIFIVIGVGGFILLVLIGILNIMASKYLGQVRKYNFILITSILNCVTGILGILLGVFAIIEINKTHVKEVFEQNKVSEIPE